MLKNTAGEEGVLRSIVSSTVRVWAREHIAEFTQADGAAAATTARCINCGSLKTPINSMCAYNG